MSATVSDVIVIGGGIAGASAASEIARTARVVLLEQESQPGYHTTGRSAAIYTQNYGNAAIRALTLASHEFLQNPGERFADHPILGPRGALFIAREDQLAQLETALAEGQALVPSIRGVSGDEACAINPALRRDHVSAAVFEPHAMDIDVAALHGGFLRALRQRGGEIATRAEVRAMDRRGGVWTVETPSGRYEAPVVVNAAGAWCDEVAKLAGAAPLGLIPKRRSVMTFAAPEGMDISRWPLTIDIDEQFYFKSDAGVVMASPADETPSPPCDAQPEEIDIAIAADRVEKATILKVRRILSKWAGLRSFLADKTPAVGFDGGAEGFFWLAGQGGYGIQTSPAMARLAAGLITGGGVPGDLAEHGVTAAALAPSRLRT